MRARTLLTLGSGLLLTTVLGLAACSGSTSATPAAADPNAPITFATTPLGDDPKAENPIHAFAELAESETGRQVEIVDVPDYTAVVEAIRNHHVDIAIMSGFPSALAVNTGEVDALVAWPGDGKPVSTCLVLADSPLQKLTDLTPDTVVAFADPASSSGYFMPVSMLHDAGLTKDEDYTPLFSGGHDLSFIALKKGQAQVACTSTVFPKMTDSKLFPFAPGETRSIGESKAMPIAVTVLADTELAPDKRDALLKALPTIFVPENADRLGSMFSAVQGSAPILQPAREEFRPFVEIAAIAGVDLADLG